MSKSKKITRRRIDPLHVDVGEAARSRLRLCPYPSIKRLTCEFSAGNLTLVGRVRTFFEKQVAQEAVRNLDGVNQLVNGVEVA